MLITLQAYADRRGVSVQAIHKAIKKGRITVLRQPGGKMMVDPDQADRDWESRTSPINGGDQNKPRADPPAEPAPRTMPERGALTAVQAQTLLKAAQAKLAQLEYQKKSEKLVDAEAVKKKWAELATIVKTKVLGVASKAKQRIPELTPDAVIVLEEICREALEELADE